MSNRNPIVNSPGRECYYTNSGNPYSTVDKPSDLADIDKLAQPKDAAFINKNNSGTVVSGDFRGQGILANGDKNILWDNLAGTPNDNIGEGISLVKVTNMTKLSHGGGVKDQPFIQYGKGGTSINGRAMSGSAPELWNRRLHQRETEVTVNEWELVSETNPYLAQVKGRTTTYTRYPLEIVDTMMVGKNGRRFQVIPMDRGYTPPALEKNDDINKMPYLDADTRPQMSNLKPYLRNIALSEDLLNLTIKVDIQGDGTYTIDWGDTNKDENIANGTSTTHTYTATGIYDVTITNDADATDVKVLPNVFMKDASYVPTPLAWETSFVSNANPWTVTGKKAKMTLKVTGSPAIKVMVDWGDNTGSLQKLQDYFPVSQTLTDGTFEIEHTYRYAGSFMVNITAEHLFDEGISEQREQITILKSVKVA